MAGDTRLHPVSEGGRCDRARQWSSLRADGELSELEEALLEQHLEHCGECAEYDARLRSTAELLRTAPVEAAAVRFQIPAERPVRFPLSRRLAVAAIAVAAAAGSLVGSTLQRPATHPEAPGPQVAVLTGTRDLDLLRQLPRQQRVTPLSPARERGSLPEGII
jgi:ferric-dicitrate binding protein FerR (iron transport regulator)